MEKNVFDWMLHRWSAQWIALYYIPMLACAVIYISRTVGNIRKDRLKRAEMGSYYRGTDTIGALVVRALLTITPGLNLCAAVWELRAASLIVRIGAPIRWILNLLSQPLVPYRPDQKETESEKVVSHSVE